ncbi:MAG: hypothetical protein IKM63_05495, partial [Firmicutes bacterium]|nr:hypothetical protein [Bacillota bacterium]MBR6799510.1 hypothetical protein [Bacillota bacterium]
ATTSTSYINTGLTVGKTYYYKVRPYRLVGKSYKYGPYSSIVYNKTSLGIPSNVTVAIEDEGIIIKWTSVQGAKKYIVERNDGKSFSTTSTSYKDVTVEKDTTYKYKVKAYNTIYSSYSPYSPEIIIETNNNDDELIPEEPTVPEEPIKSDTLFEYKGVSISLGQEWSDEILNSLKEKTVGYYTTVRPDYIYDSQGNLHDATVHMFNIRDYTKEGVVHNYDEFIQIQVSEGKIVSWETACDKFGTVKGKDFIKGMVPTELELPNGVYVHSNIYATGVYNAYRLDAGRSTYSQNAALTGGLANFSQVSMIAFKENQKYWDAEKTIAFHWINALRVEFGSEPLKYLSAFEKGVYSGILSDDTYYENQVCGAQAKAETIAMSKAIDSSIKATHETVNYPVGPLAGILSAHNEEMCEELANIAEGGENLASSGSGESCVEIYLTSSAHLSPLLYENTTHVGIGIKDYWNVEMFGVDVFGINTDDVINYSNN